MPEIVPIPEDFLPRVPDRCIPDHYRVSPVRLTPEGALRIEDLLGREVPRDLSPLKPILHGSWEGWKGGLGPPPGGGPKCANVHFG